MEAKANNFYMQYQMELDIPFVIKFDDQSFFQLVAGHFEKKGFSEINNDQVLSIHKNHARALRMVTIKRATARAAEKIGRESSVLDVFGNENVTPGVNYNVYRNLGVAMLVFSNHGQFWEMGIKESQFKNNEKEFSNSIFRMMSFALSSMGIIGFWGVPVDEGVVIHSQKETNGECVFIDTERNYVYTVDGVKSFEHGFNIIKLDETMHGNMKRLKTDELFSFLNVKNNYFNYGYKPYAFQESVLKIAERATGLVYPKENFQPRTNLSY